MFSILNQARARFRPISRFLLEKMFWTTNRPGEYGADPVADTYQIFLFLLLGANLRSRGYTGRSTCTEYSAEMETSFPERRTVN